MEVGGEFRGGRIRVRARACAYGFPCGSRNRVSLCPTSANGETFRRPFQKCLDPALEVALKKSDRCFSLLSVCQDHVDNGRASDAVATVKVIRSEGIELKNDMETYKRNLQSSEAVQKKQLDECTDQEYKLQEDIVSKQADILRYEKDIQDYERSVKKYEAEFREADNDWDRYHRDYKIAKEKLDDFKKWWWVPIYGQILLIREVFEWNSGKMDEADERKDRATRQKANAERQRDLARSKLRESQSSVENAKLQLVQCRKKIKECHQKCTDLKALISTLLQAEEALTKILHTTDSACKNTDILKETFEKYGGCLKLLQCMGTQKKMAYVGEQWECVNGMVASTRRNKALNGAM